RKDVLSGCFGLLALLAYQRYAQQPSLGRYLLVTAAFVLSLLAKPMLVTLPCLLLLLDYWPLDRCHVADHRSRDGAQDVGVRGRQGPLPVQYPVTRLLLEKLPLLLLSFGCSALAWHGQQRFGALRSLAVLPLSTRLENAIVSYLSYLRMTIAPVGLAPLYPL